MTGLLLLLILPGRPRESTMNKENDNVVGRLGSSNHYELGSEIMCSMPEEAAGNESNTCNGEAEDQEFLRNYTATIATLSATFFATIIISVIVTQMWNEDEIKLHVLDALIKILQTMARLFGGWALECERTYNDYASALH
jgi:hypothetical protein